MQSLSKKLKIANNDIDLIISFEGEGVAKVYHPHRQEDIQNLCRAANIEEFIQEKRKQNYPELFIFESNRYNRGVVTNEPIKKNKTICKYLGEIGSIDQATNKNKIKKFLLKENLIGSFTEKTIEQAVYSYIKRVTDYAFEITEKPSDHDTVLAHNKRSLAAFINHNSTDPNVKAYVINNTIYYKAARDINKGEQLIIDYGPDYDYHDQLYYIPSTENHLHPGQFLTDYFHYYHKFPIELTSTLKKLLKVNTDKIMMPKFLYKLLYKKSIPSKLFKLTEFEKRLPLFEVFTLPSNKTTLTIHVPENQQNITPLIFAVATQKREIVSLLVNKFKVDVFAKTLQDLDALILAIKSSETEEDFIQIAKPIIKKFGPLLERVGVIGSDNLDQTALHLLVDLEWTKAISFFDNINFFEFIDESDFDPFIASIAHGKTKALLSLVKLSCIKKHMYELLLSDDENNKDLVLKRALQNTPLEKYDEVMRILKKAISRRKILRKKLRHLIDYDL